ncbi:MAG TPA: RNA polymerase sigma factor [Thermoanaerobaculia bacterium]|nr:RNA polymerase sigma factor [Thermoanaerobaculia bacterium]
MHSEAELVERFRATGEGRWFEELYRLSRRRVFGVCMKILRDVDRAQDACHEAFLRAYERFGTLRGDRFSSWVCRIAANQCYDALRRQARAQEEHIDDLENEPANDVAIEREAATREKLDRAVEIVRALAPHQRAVFLLKHVEGRSYREIELFTGYTTGEVRSFLQNARRNVRLGWERGQDAASAGSVSARRVGARGTPS